VDKRKRVREGSVEEARKSKEKSQKGMDKRLLCRMLYYE
jgi:hypothetical protein